MTVSEIVRKLEYLNMVLENYYLFVTGVGMGKDDYGHVHVSSMKKNMKWEDIGFDEMPVTLFMILKEEFGDVRYLRSSVVIISEDKCD